MPVDFHSNRRVRVKTGVVFSEPSDLFHVKHQPLSFSNRAICTIKFASYHRRGTGRSTWNVRSEVQAPVSPKIIVPRETSPCRHL